MHKLSSLPPLKVVSQVGLVNLGFDCPPISCDIDARPSVSLHDWLQRRGRAARAFPGIKGDRSYQTRLIEGIREAMRAGKTPLVVSPCGSGKSYIAAMMAESAKRKGKSIAFITPRRVLVDDISGRLKNFGVDHGVIMADRADNQHRTKVVSIQTLLSRGIKLNVDLIFIDEAHLFLTEERIKFIQEHSHIRRVCLTATPVKTDGTGLNRIADKIVLGPSTQNLIDWGFLVPSKVYAPEMPDISKLRVSGEDLNENEVASVMMAPGIVGNIVKHWLAYGQNRPTIVHACNVAHSKSIVERFNAAGIAAAHIDASSSDRERAEVFERLIVNAPHKKDSVLIDLAGNTSMRFGFPEDDREWTLEDQERAPLSPHAQSLSVRRCPKCWYTFRSSQNACPGCGNRHVPEQRTIRERNEQLVLQRADQRAEAKRSLQEQLEDPQGDESSKLRLQVGIVKRFKAIADKKGYKWGWVQFRYKSLTGHYISNEVKKHAGY